MTDLFEKYNVPAPRYTSYPTVPYWNESGFSSDAWQKSVIQSFGTGKDGISLYIHLPFCESLCTFCGCSKRITKNHNHEQPYIAALLKEWRIYCRLLGERPLIRELHLGGGTPTFFSVKNLEDLINGIFSFAGKSPDLEMGFEGHPNNTTKEHLQKFYDLGFRRVSFGVQDYSDDVQRAIHRIQPFEHVAKVTLWARDIGYTSIGHDLVYGLPFQTPESIADTVEKTMALQPDRIAFYSYAHTPWIKGNGQRGFAEIDLPYGPAKKKLYDTGREILAENGYAEIGMDHFALPDDALFKASAAGKLNRNFMGYTESDSKLLVGLGISAISDSWFGFAQNTKNLEDYYQMLEWGELPVVKGHISSGEDVSVRTHISNLMCRFRTDWSEAEIASEVKEIILAQLRPMEKDGLLSISPDAICVSETGKNFLRNIAMAFDIRMLRKRPETQLFSMTI